MSHSNRFRLAWHVVGVAEDVGGPIRAWWHVMGVAEDVAEDVGRWFRMGRHMGVIQDVGGGFERRGRWWTWQRTCVGGFDHVARRGRRRRRRWAVIRKVGEDGEWAWSARVIFVYGMGDSLVCVFRDCGGRKGRSPKI